jgi:hypothetical protein
MAESHELAHLLASALELELRPKFWISAGCWACGTLAGVRM